MTRPPDRYEFRWTSRHLAALIVVCLIAGAIPAARAISGRCWIGAVLPTWPDRLAAAQLRIDPNTAPTAHLQCLPGIGPAKADAIVAYRNDPASGRFDAPEDLKAVYGIGDGSVGKMTPYLHFE